MNPAIHRTSGVIFNTGYAPGVVNNMNPISNLLSPANYLKAHQPISVNKINYNFYIPFKVTQKSIILEAPSLFHGGMCLKYFLLSRKCTLDIFLIVKERLSVKVNMTKETTFRTIKTAFCFVSTK